MPYVINVPQGFGANLITASSFYQIEGLYTDSFSTCNIIVCIGKEKLMLVHADLQIDLNKLKEAIEWVGEPNDVIIIKRKEGDYLLSELQRYFKKEAHTQKFIIRSPDEDCFGIFVSFTKSQDNRLYPQIKQVSRGSKPTNLLHHPQEQQLLTVEKIEQVIGIRARQKTGKSRYKQLYIFDGRFWEPMEPRHFSVNCAHPLTQEEMALFAKTDTYISIANKLRSFIQCSSTDNPLLSLGEVCFDVAPYIEAYLNNYDYNLLFKQNMLDLLLNPEKLPGYDPTSVTDSSLKEELLTLLKEQTDIYIRAEEITSKYKKTAPETVYKDNFFNAYNNIVRYYKERKYYSDLNVQYKEKLSSVKKLSVLATKAYREGKHSAAFKLFSDVVIAITPCCIKENPELAIAYYNFGRSLFMIDKFEEAQSMLKTSLYLKKNYVQPSPLPADIEKTEKALDECNRKLENTTVTNSNSLLLLGLTNKK